MSKPTVNELKEIINRIKNINIKIFSKTLDEKEQYFYDNHKDLMEKYPFIVYQICSGGDLSMLDIMLEELQKVEDGRKTNEQADVEMGEYLAEKYVSPLIKKINK